jgi:hypothetical protein
MVAAPIVLTTLLALVGAPAPGGRGTLERVAPATLEPSGRTMSVPDTSLGFAWARNGATLAFVAKPIATGQPIRLVDSRTLRTERVIQVGDRDVCGLTFDRGELVALTANQPCYWAHGRFAIIRISSHARRTVQVPGLRSVFPTNLAFGDGKAFVARAGAGVDEVDLRSGVVVRHRPKRSLAKGEGIVFARWLGGHQLGVGAAVVDVRTWRARILEPGAVGVARAGAGLAAYGPRGVAVVTRSGRLRYRLLRGASIRVVCVAGRYLYAASDRNAWIVDLRARRVAAAAIDPNLVWSLLVL